MKAADRGGLFLVLSGHLAGDRIDEVHPSARRAGDGLVDLGIGGCWFGRAALNLEAAGRTAIKERSHHAADAA